MLIHFILVSNTLLSPTNTLCLALRSPCNANFMRFYSQLVVIINPMLLERKECRGRYLYIFAVGLISLGAILYGLLNSKYGMAYKNLQQFDSTTPIYYLMCIPSGMVVFVSLMCINWIGFMFFVNN